MKGLTAKQQNILDFIEEFSRTEGMAPTVHEIAEHFGIKPATAFSHLRALQRKGCVSRTSKARSLTLMRGTSPKHLSMTLSIPILGRISAGQPLLAEEHVEEIIQIDSTMLPNSNSDQRLFGLRVNGESMIEAGIMDHDIIVARQQNTAVPGEIVVALVDGEATVKSFYLSETQVELRPANPNFQPQFYPLDAVLIQGVVAAMFRVY
jgi:repressor LexA